MIINESKMRWMYQCGKLIKKIKLKQKQGWKVNAIKIYQISELILTPTNLNLT